MRLPNEAAKAALIAYDSGDVTDPEEREALLQKKLAFYLEFVRSGQIWQAKPELAGHSISIEVVCTQPPTEAMRQVENIGTQDGAVSIPVRVTSDQEFRARLGLKSKN